MGDRQVLRGVAMLAAFDFPLSNNHRSRMKTLILALSILCVETPFQEGNNACSAQARHIINARPESWIQNRAGKAQGRENMLRLRTDMVTLSVSVIDKRNNFAPGLGPQDFEVYEDGINQRIEFFSGEDIPLNIGILLDTSGSLKQHFDQSLKAAGEFIRAGHPDDDFFFMTFSKKIKIQVEGDDLDKVDEYLRSAEPEGLTAFYDSVYFGLEKVKQGKHRKRALIVISDGQDNSSRYKYGELMKLVKEADVQIYCIGIGDTSSDGDFASGSILMEGLARLTGGESFFPGGANKIKDAVNSIALLLRHQYSIGYYPSNPRSDKNWRKIKVQLHPSRKTQGLRVSVKEGYYALPSPTPPKR
jgi:Ca-activated chloride channel family protein